jgi:Na+/H+ antiporter NhaD/arsenite permease-like protein
MDRRIERRWLRVVRLDVRVVSSVVLAMVALPAHAAGFSGASLTLAWIVPFAGILASIALVPLIAPKLWHRHFGKIALGWATAFVVPFALAFGAGEAIHQVAHAALLEYLPFVVLLFALYTVSGGIGIFGDLHGAPAMNTALLAIGAVLANLMGTTGAAMVLVRPLIRANQHRKHNVHVLVFFIFIVANVGGSLTPLGDPPLFLGFLNGVSFFWTTHAMLAPTLALCGALLAIFYAVDRYLYAQAGDRRATEGAAVVDTPPASRLRLEGKINLVFLVAIVAAVLLSGFWRPGISFELLGTPLALQDLARDVILIVIAAVSLRATPKGVHEANGFNWGPMEEVAKLFAAIFVTIIPAIAILKAGEAGALSSLTRMVTTATGEPDNPMYFWLTGVLSAFLDNAPTYLVFFNLAGADAVHLMAQRETLAAISGGAVFMGALSYIGNAPNFMVRSIAEDRGIRMPSFFGYLLWSIPILVPLFVVLTVLFIS